MRHNARRSDNNIWLLYLLQDANDAKTHTVNQDSCCWFDRYTCYFFSYLPRCKKQPHKLLAALLWWYMKHENLVLSKELIRSNYHRERFGKLTFRALAFRHSLWALLISHGCSSTFINSFDKTQFSCFNLPLTQCHDFFRYLKSSLYLTTLNIKPFIMTITIF